MRAISRATSTPFVRQHGRRGSPVRSRSRSAGGRACGCAHHCRMLRRTDPEEGRRRARSRRLHGHLRRMIAAAWDSGAAPGSLRQPRRRRDEREPGPVGALRGLVRPPRLAGLGHPSGAAHAGGHRGQDGHRHQAERPRPGHRPPRLPAWTTVRRSPTGTSTPPDETDSRDRARHRHRHRRVSGSRVRSPPRRRPAPVSASS